MTFSKCFYHMPNGNIWNLFKMTFVFWMWSRCSSKRTNVIKMFSKDQMWSKCSHQPYGGNILRMLLDKFQMIANCYGGSNVLYMLILHSKCCINVPISCVRPGTCRNIWNVPNLLSVGKWWVHSTRACNVLKMFSLVSRPPCPQWVEQIVSNRHLVVTFLGHLTSRDEVWRVGRKR